MKIIRLKKGDLVLETLQSKLLKMNGGLVVGLGAVSWAKLKIYNLERKTYSSKKIDGPLEVVSFSATIAKTPENITGLHAHIVVSNDKFNVFGGHLKEAEVAATFEAAIIESGSEIKRYFDKKIGLNLIKD